MEMQDSTPPAEEEDEAGNSSSCSADTDEDNAVEEGFEDIMGEVDDENVMMED